MLLVLRRFDLQSNIRERNTVVKRDPTVTVISEMFDVIGRSSTKLQSSAILGFSNISRWRTTKWNSKISA